MMNEILKGCFGCKVRFFTFNYTAYSAIQGPAVFAQLQITLHPRENRREVPTLLLPGWCIEVWNHGFMDEYLKTPASREPGQGGQLVG